MEKNSTPRQAVKSALVRAAFICAACSGTKQMFRGESISEEIHKLCKDCLAAKEMSSELQPLRAATAGATCAFDDALAFADDVLWAVLNTLDQNHLAYILWAAGGATGLPDVVITAETIGANWDRLKASLEKFDDVAGVADGATKLLRRMDVEEARVTATEQDELSDPSKYSKLQAVGKHWLEKYDCSPDKWQDMIKSGRIRISKESTTKRVSIFYKDWPPGYSE